MERTANSLYREFADLEARGVSDTYFEWADGVAGDPELLALIEQLPPAKRQPNLVFAAARYLGAPQTGYPRFREWLTSAWPDVVPVVMARATQTNEAARCAVLLPVLSTLEAPLALSEAGTSAGLCHYPDRYSYRYTTPDGPVVLDPHDGPSTVELPCVIDRASVPTALPEVVWRAGVDLKPIDVGDADQIHWLETLVWPEHEERRRRLRDASALVAREPADLVQGDLLDEIPALIAQAPAGSRVVVFHSAVLVYLAPERRAAFCDLMSSMPEVTWISNEGAHVLAAIANQVDSATDGRMILAVNGGAIARTGPHGQSYEALGSFR